MFVSAEVRWFWEAVPPDPFKSWFLSTNVHPCAAGGGGRRVDVYLNDPEQTELGVKTRGSKPGVEIKCLVARLPDAIAEGPFQGPGELWTKLTSPSLHLPPDLAVRVIKIRWLRKFDTSTREVNEIATGSDEEPLVGSWPIAGCNVELTEVSVRDKTAWTFGLEAFDGLEAPTSLRSVATLLSGRNPPPMGEVDRISYPAWLASINAPK